MLTMIQPAASQQTTLDPVDIINQLKQLSSSMQTTTQKLGSLGHTDVSTGATGVLGEMMTELRLRLSTLDSIGVDMATQQAQMAGLSKRIPDIFSGYIQQVQSAKEQAEYVALFPHYFFVISNNFFLL